MTTKNNQSVLQQMCNYSKIMADTSDFIEVQKYPVEGVTTNPSLLLTSTQSNWGNSLIVEANALANLKPGPLGTKEIAKVFLMVAIAKRLIIAQSGKISLEVDPRLSYDTKQTVDFAHLLINHCREAGLNTDRILVKIIATWEGIKAAHLLETQGINCNLTLIFNEVQAVASAQAGAYMISPFVGRILDWHINNKSFNVNSELDDPGVRFVINVVNHIKNKGYSTAVMAASFRNTQQIIDLCGCDYLTINLSFLEKLSNDYTHIKRNLNIPKNNKDEETITKEQFDLALQKDKMANENLHNGIEKFISDYEALDNMYGNM